MDAYYKGDGDLFPDNVSGGGDRGVLQRIAT